MTIQRKYSLPNCTLILEGLSDATSSTDQSDVRPLLSILVNAECHLAAAKQPLIGGRDFVESLVTAVSSYAQEFLSKVHHPEDHKNQLGLVQLQKVNDNRHRLIVQPEPLPTGSPQFEGGNPSATMPIQIDLTTVQLFDLVEAVDQFFADSQTLPDLSLQLRPVPKRYNGSAQTIVKQAVPATVGVSSLALAAIAFFFVPIPDVQRPTLPKPQSNSGQSTNLARVPEMTDSSQLDALSRKLYNRLNQAWKKRFVVEHDLVYRLGVAPDGAITGYKSVSSTANYAIEQTPLPQLLQNPAISRATIQEPIAQFKVVFTNKGVLQVSPW